MFFYEIHKRIRFFFLIFIVGCLIVVGRVFWIEVFSNRKLSKLANDLWSRDLPIGADRGIIYDRNGKLLATNLTTTSLILIPNQINNKEEVAKSLGEILGVSYEEMYRHVSKKTSMERVHPEGRRLSFEVADKIEALHYKGVYLVKESKRYYPNEEVLAHVLGYVGIDNQGLSGIELEYDSYLTGKDGAIKYYSNGKGESLEHIEVYEKPQNGVNIYLTIDLDLQKSVERELDQVMAKYTPEHALIVAMNPQNGEILAMASRPNFNPNNYQSYDYEVINRNLPIWMMYEPGSTFKIMTLAASLEEKVVNLFEDHYFDSGSIKVEGSTIHCWKHKGHGNQTYLQVVENSCNPGFVVMGEKLGKERLMKYIRGFGFGEKTGIDLNGESTGLLFKTNKMGPVELATTSFGQGISVTPIAQITAVSAAINGGYLYKPYLVKVMSEAETNSVIYQNNSSYSKKVISDETSRLVRYALESVVAHGSGRNAYIENYRVGGKTGTAQKVVDGHYEDGNYILSFMGFMPADNPQIAVYVAIDHPHGVVQYGGTTAAPIAKKILESAISLYHYPESQDGMEKEYVWYDVKYKKLDNVLGLSFEEAKKNLLGYNVLVSGSGERVVYQSPSAGTYVKEGTTVKLMLE